MISSNEVRANAHKLAPGDCAPRDVGSSESTKNHVQMTPTTGLPKPKLGESCNGCGYCCITEPCKLAKEFLNCMAGPCVALESQDGRVICGLVRNPLGYLFQAAHPEANVPVLDAAPAVAAGYQLSVDFASALGFGNGCDADDDDESDNLGA